MLRCVFLLVPFLLGAFAPVDARGAGQASRARIAEPPVNVYYPESACRGHEIELEVWSRDHSAWVEHPAHARVLPGSCQLENEHQLWDELRWRCATPDDVTAERWIVGVDMFEDGLTRRCGATNDAHVFGEMRVEITTPLADVPIRAGDPTTTVEGEVWVAGRRGVQYDIVVAIDASGAGGREDIARQVEAVRRFVRHNWSRLGEVRIGLFSFPHPHPAESAGEAGLRELALTEDAGALLEALAEIEARGPAGRADFPGALAFGMRETQLLQVPRDEGARLYSRRLLLMAGHAERSLPFQPLDGPARFAHTRLIDLAASARERGIALHLFALGVDDGARPPLVDSMLRHARGSFSWIGDSEDDTAYLLDSGLPYVSKVVVRNATTGQLSGEVDFDESGEFHARIPATFGFNEVVVDAESSQGLTARDRRSFEFDGSLVRENLRAAERVRIDRLRRRGRVEIEAIGD